MSSIAPLRPTLPLDPPGAADANSGAKTEAQTGVGPAAAKAQPVKLLNPSLELDPSLGINVLEYFSASGQLTQSFPSQKQLQTSRLYGLGNAGPDPPPL